MFLKHYFKGETLYNLGAFAERLVSGVAGLFILSQLEVYKYGVYILIFSFYHLTAGLFLQPLQEVVFNDLARLLAEGRETAAKKLYLENLKVRLSLALLLSISLFFGAEFVARYYDQDIANLFRLLSPLYLIDVSYTSMRMFFRLKLKFGLISFRPVIFKIAKLVLIIIFIFGFNFGVREAIISYVGAALIAAVTLIPAFFKNYRPWRGLKPAPEPILSEIVKKHGKWPIFGETLSGLVSSIQPWLIKFFVSTEGVALFSVAENLYGTVKTFFPASTLGALIPREVANRERAAEILIRGSKYLTIVACAMALGGFLFVPPLVRWMLPHYVDSLKLYQILLLMLPIFSLRTISATFLLVLRRQKFLFLIQVVKILSELLIPIPLLYFWGLTGMPLERIFSSIIITALMFYYLLHYEFAIGWPRSLFAFDRRDKMFFKKFFTRSYLSLKDLRGSLSTLFFD